MIRGACFINGIPLIVIIDMGVTHSFISHDCVRRLDLRVSIMTIDTPTSGYVATTLVCLNCSLSMYDQNFGIDLICLRLNQLDIIMGIYWLSFNHVLINCFDKIVSFPVYGRSKDPRFIFANQTERSFK